MVRVLNLLLGHLLRTCALARDVSLYFMCNHQEQGVKLVIRQLKVDCKFSFFLETFNFVTVNDVLFDNKY